MGKTYGVGIMGAGNISAAYLRLAPLFRNLEVRGVADVIPEAAKKRAEEFNVAAQTPDELLKNSEIDVIVNLTVPAAHYQVTTDILSAGKHAYSEKPFVLSVEEGKAIRKQAEERKLKVGSAPDTFLGGAHQQARSIIDSGKVGKIASGTMHVLSRGMEHWHPNPDFFFQVGGGPILDLGPYYITDLISLVGPIKRVTAFTGMARAEREVTAEGPYKGTMIKVGTPTTIHAVLEFHNGAIITLGASWDVASHGHHNIELYGTEGSVYVPDPKHEARAHEGTGHFPGPVRGRQGAVQYARQHLRNGRPGLGYKGVQIPTWVGASSISKRRRRPRPIATSSRASPPSTGSRSPSSRRICRASSWRCIRPMTPRSTASPRSSVHGNSQGPHRPGRCSSSSGRRRRRRISGSTRTRPSRARWPGPIIYPWPQRPAGLVERPSTNWPSAGRRSSTSSTRTASTSATRSIRARTCTTGSPSRCSSSAVNNHPRANLLYDPSHFVLQQLDYLAFIDIYHERIKRLPRQGRRVQPDRQAGRLWRLPELGEPGRPLPLAGRRAGRFRRDLLQAERNTASTAGRCSNGNAPQAPEEGAAKARRSSPSHIIRVTEKAFDDFAGAGTDKAANRKMLGLS
jgi:predicted dehydrogenase